MSLLPTDPDGLEFLEGYGDAAQRALEEERTNDELFRQELLQRRESIRQALLLRGQEKYCDTPWDIEISFDDYCILSCEATTIKAFAEEVDKAKEMDAKLRENAGQRFLIASKSRWSWDPSVLYTGLLARNTPTYYLTHDVEHDKAGAHPVFGTRLEIETVYGTRGEVDEGRDVEDNFARVRAGAMAERGEKSGLVLKERKIVIGDKLDERPDEFIFGRDAADLAVGVDDIQELLLRLSRTSSYRYMRLTKLLFLAVSEGPEGLFSRMLKKEDAALTRQFGEKAKAS